MSVPKPPHQRPTLTARPLLPRPAKTSVGEDGPTASLLSPSVPSVPSRGPPREPGPGGALPGHVWIEREGVRLPLPLVEGERYVVGRHVAADIVFADDDISRLHGVLAFQAGAWTYEDYGSANGTELLRGGDGGGGGGRGGGGGGEGAPLPPRAPVRVGVGDVLVFGSNRCQLRFGSGPPAFTRGEGTEVSAAARTFAERLKLAARTRVPVFLLGRSGSGKTFSARRLHELGRLPGAFVPVNCARLPTEPTALHSELLGHVRGAYTGAEAARTGKLVLADGGTLFLDEVESLPELAQGFLLDVLEGSGDLAPLGAGATRLKPLTFRLVSASKKPLADSTLRPDLCERLAEGHLWKVPDLEERSEDIPGLLARFAGEQSTLLGVSVVVAPDAVRFAQQTAFPGQVRQLRAMVVALAQLGLAARVDDDGRRVGGEGPVVLRHTDFARHLAERAQAFAGAAELPRRGDARRLDRAAVQAALEAAGGNQVQAAKALGIARNTLRRKLTDD
jgi:transcriptional regulator with AAA-type ATPase domain